MSTDPRIAAALERAERFRRDQVPAEERRGIEQRVWAEPLWWPHPAGDGWQIIGQVFVLDDWRSSALPVHWHPETDRVRVGRLTPPPTAPPDSLSPDLWRPLWATANGVEAEAGWVFTYRGQDYSPEAARVIAIGTDLREWTWRRTPDDQ